MQRRWASGLGQRPRCGGDRRCGRLLLSAVEVQVGGLLRYRRALVMVRVGLGGALVRGDVVLHGGRGVRRGVECRADLLGRVHRKPLIWRDVHRGSRKRLLRLLHLLDSLLELGQLHPCLTRRHRRDHAVAALAHVGRARVERAGCDAPIIGRDGDEAHAILPRADRRRRSAHEARGLLGVSILGTGSQLGIGIARDLCPVERR